MGYVCSEVVFSKLKYSGNSMDMQGWLSYNAQRSDAKESSGWPAILQLGSLTTQFGDETFKYPTKISCWNQNVTLQVCKKKKSSKNLLLLHEKSLSVGNIVQFLDVALVEMEINDTVEIRLQTIEIGRLGNHADSSVEQIPDQHLQLMSLF